MPKKQRRVRRVWVLEFKRLDGRRAVLWKFSPANAQLRYAEQQRCVDLESIREINRCIRETKKFGFREYLRYTVPCPQDDYDSGCKKIDKLHRDIENYCRNAQTQRRSIRHGRDVRVRPEFWEQAERDARRQITNIRNALIQAARTARQQEIEDAKQHATTFSQSEDSDHVPSETCPGVAANSESITDRDTQTYRAESGVGAVGAGLGEDSGSCAGISTERASGTS